MSYYPTIEEDIARAKQILEKGRPAHEEVAYLPEPMRVSALAGGTIYGADNYAAYKLLESFVARVQELERMNARLRTHATHKRGCPFASHPLTWTDEQKCSCGLDAQP